MKTDRTKFIVLIGVLGISFSAIFGKLLTAPSMTAAMYRMLFTSVLMLPYVLMKHREELRGAGIRDILCCAASGVFLGFHFTSYFESLKYTGISSSSVLVDTEVIIVAVLLICFIGEKIPRAGIIGIALAFIGSVVIAAGDFGNGTDLLRGDILAFAGACFSAGYTLIGRSERKKLSTSIYTFLVYASAAVTLLICCILTGTRLTGFPVSDYLAVMGMVLFCTLMGHSIFSFALGKISAAYVSMAKLGEPVCATILGFFIFSEVPKINQIVGGAIVIAGICIYLFNKEGRKSV